MSPFKSQKRVYREFSEIFNHKDSVFIIIFADPDSLASAMAIKRLLWRRVQSVTIGHFNEIDRFDNLTMVRLLKIPIVKLDDVDVSQFSKAVLVDNQPHHHDALSEFEYDVVIDHHPETAPVKATFVDIRPDYGATSSMMTEYLRAAKIRPSKSLATALTFAIRVDTGNFSSGLLEKDVKAFRFLFPYADMNVLRRIELADMGLKDLKYFQQAVENKRILAGKIFSHLDNVSSPDIIVQVADFFMRCHEVNWVVVSGVYKQTMVVIVRNDGFRKNAGARVIRAFGRFGNAGGRRAMARAEMPLTDLQKNLRKDDPTDLGRFVIRQFKKGGGS